MYTEENARGRFPLRDILLKAIVVIIFLILIIFIITKITTPNSNVNKTDSNYDKVFSKNLETMENVAYEYYTADRLPKEIGDVNELTLREMINTNLLEAFTDANGKACDVNKSYIRLTKNDDDYTLRVSLKCDEKEDYTLTKVGEYDYCEHDICKKDPTKETEEETSKEASDEVKITEPTNDTSGNISNNTSSGNSNTNTNNNGNTNNQGSQSEIVQTTPQVMYEYRKVNNPVLSGWSSWSSWNYNNDRYSAIKCSDTDVNCLREVQLYSRREKVGTDDTGKAVYATVNYYSYRTRTLISSGSIDVKWSYYNDTNLLNEGYTYTGNTK